MNSPIHDMKHRMCSSKCMNEPKIDATTEETADVRMLLIRTTFTRRIHYIIQCIKRCDRAPTPRRWTHYSYSPGDWRK